MNGNNIDILLLGDNCLDTVGGEQESTKIIINGLKDKYLLGIVQPGIVSNPKKEATYFNLTKHTRLKHLVKRPLDFIRYILKVRKIINFNKPKVIHTQAQASFFIVALLKKFKLISKDNYVIHTERGLYTKYSKLLKYIFYFLIRELDTLVTTTEFNMNYWKDALEKRGFSLEYKIIENTAGELFETYDELLDKSQERKLIIGFAGRYTDWKNWPLAVEVSEKLNEILGDQVEVKMAIGCLDEKALVATKSMCNKLEKMFEDRFNGEINISLDEMNKFYYDIDVFVLTSNHNTESFGRTLVEAMSRKTVVLTTDAGGSVEVVGDKENVCNNPDEFINRILYFYNNYHLMDSEKKKNLFRVKKHFSLKNNIYKHKELYTNIIDENTIWK